MKKTIVGSLFIINCHYYFNFSEDQAEASPGDIGIILKTISKADKVTYPNIVVDACFIAFINNKIVGLKEKFGYVADLLSDDGNRNV